MLGNSLTDLNNAIELDPGDSNAWKGGLLNRELGKVMLLNMI